MKVKRTKNDKVPDDIRFVGRWPLVSANTNKKSIRSNSYDWVQILSVSAFCFAIMSWYATANGLRNYVFNGDAWQAYLISFAIQAILFVLNLKLPGLQEERWQEGKYAGISPCCILRLKYVRKFILFLCIYCRYFI